MMRWYPRYETDFSGRGPGRSHPLALLAKQVAFAVGILLFVWGVAVVVRPLTHPQKAAHGGDATVRHAPTTHTSQHVGAHPQRKAHHGPAKRDEAKESMRDGDGPAGHVVVAAGATEPQAGGGPGFGSTS